MPSRLRLAPPSIVEAWLFSVDTLSYLTGHYPNRVGEIVYLFVFGDLIDVYQNWSGSPSSRTSKDAPKG